MIIPKKIFLINKKEKLNLKFWTRAKRLLPEIKWKQFRRFQQSRLPNGQTVSWHFVIQGDLISMDKFNSISMLFQGIVSSV